MAELVTPTGDVDNSALTNLDILDSADVISIANNTSAATTVFDTLDSLPTTGLSAGQQAFVNGNNRLYISNGTGWYNLTFVNRTPTWAVEPDASYDIEDSATPLIVTARATDSDNSIASLVNQSVVSDSAQYMVNISNDSSVWTFTPKSADSIGIEVAAGNLTDSNGDFVYTFKWSDGINFVSKAVTIGYSPTGGGGFSWGGDRGLFMGISSSYSDIMYIDIAGSGGNSAQFGNLTPERQQLCCGASTTRTLMAGGYDFANSGNSGRSPVIDYVTTATTGNASSFGSLTAGRNVPAGMSNGTRAVFVGGYTNGQGNGDANWTRSMDYVTIDTTGNAVYFGALTHILSEAGDNGAGDATRGLIMGGIANTGSTYRQIQYITYDTTSDASVFGDLINMINQRNCAASDETRALSFGGSAGHTPQRKGIEYVTIQTTGNGSEFGDLLIEVSSNGACSNGTTAVVNAGIHMNKVTIQTTGDATDFGDLLESRTSNSASSGAAA